jgi:hypothetical protein
MKTKTAAQPIRSKTEFKNGRYVITYDLQEMKGDKFFKKSQIPKNRKFFQSETDLANTSLSNKNWVAGSYGVGCVDKIYTGSSEFEPKAASQEDQVKYQSIRRKKKYSDVKGKLSIDRYVRGYEDIYTVKAKKPVDAQTSQITAYISSSATGGVDADEIQNFVYDALNLIEQKIKAGFSIEIYHTKFNEDALRDSNHRYFSVITRTMLKEADHYTDFKRVAAASYPAMHRYIAFRSFLLTGLRVANNLGNPTGGQYIKDAIKESYDSQNKKVVVFDFKEWKSNGQKFNSDIL